MVKVQTTKGTCQVCGRPTTANLHNGQVIRNGKSTYDSKTCRGLLTKAP